MDSKDTSLSWTMKRKITNKVKEKEKSKQRFLKKAQKLKYGNSSETEAYSDTGNILPAQKSKIRKSILQNAIKYANPHQWSVTRKGQVVLSSAEEFAIRTKLIANAEKYSRESRKRRSNSGEQDGGSPPKRQFSEWDLSNSFQSDSPMHNLESCSCHLPDGLKRAQQKITSKELIVPLLKVLDANNILSDFLAMLEVLSQGLLPPRNLPLLCALDRSNFQKLHTTTKMRYFDETLEFWQVARKLCKSGGLLLFSGNKNAGQIAKGTCAPGLYDPKESSINFAVPHRQTLDRHEIGVSKYIKPGIIEDSFRLIDKKKQYILEFDAKTVSRGLQPDDVGDIDLWGLEGPPNLTEAREKLHNEMDLLTYFEDHPEQNRQYYLKLTSILKTMSERLCQMKQLKKGHKLLKAKLKKLSESHPKTEKRFNTALGSVKATIYQADNWIRRALQFNLRICEVLSMLNGTNASFNGSTHIDFASLSNVKILNRPQFITRAVKLNFNPQFVKQRSPLWHKLRKQSFVTGSSVYRAIGLGTLKEQKQHIHEYVHHFNPMKPTEEVQKRMDYGTANEINGIATLCSRIIPALMPPCSMFVEDGANFIDGRLRDGLLEVSTDGFIQMCSDQQCEHMVSDYSNVITVECKCPYPKESDLNVHYSIPLYYACQLLCEMKCKEARKALYISYSKQSTTAILLSFSEEVWETVWTHITHIYDVPKVKMPKGKPPYEDDLKMVLKQYLKDFSEFLCEVPSMTASDCTSFSKDYSDIYLQSIPLPPINWSDTQLKNSIASLSSDGQTLTEEAFELLRKKSNEILAFILTNTGRYKSPTEIAHIPIAYAMKGNSLPVATMRKLLSRVRDRCKEEGVNVLCEVSDGQWINLVTKDSEGFPLTKLQFQKSIWNDTLKWSKDRMIDFLLQYCKVEDETNEEIESNPNLFERCGRVKVNNLQVQVELHRRIVHGKRRIQKRLTLLTTSGPNSSIPLAKYIRTIPPSINEQIWKIPKSNKSAKPTSQEVVEITSADIFSKLPADVHEDALHLIQEALDESVNILDVTSYSSVLQVDEEEEQENEDLPPSQSDTSAVMVERNILTDMLAALIAERKRTCWSSMTEKDFFKSCLQSAKVAFKKFYHCELDALSNVYSSYFHQQLFKPGELKPDKIEKLIEKFGKGDKCEAKMERKVFNPLPLHRIVYKLLKTKDVPKTVIACPVAFIRQIVELEDWMRTFTVPRTIHIPHRNIFFPLFSYPEYNLQREQLEPRTLDPTHLLTNLRTHVCKSGFKGVDKGAFLRASLADPKYLPRPIVEDIIDQQNAEYAKKVFSVRVQHLMEANGDFPEAEFVKLVRQWYRACDDRGLTPEDRLDRLIAFHKYLTRDLTFGTYPPPASHVKGIPIVTFEGILDNISKRIILYAFAKRNTYNHRAVSTLGIESFFSDLSRLDFTQTQCPKSCQIPKLISTVTELNTHKHNPDKGFVMDQRRRSKYPETVMDAETEELDTDQYNHQFGIFNAHPFDMYQRETKQRYKYKPNIALPNECERGKLGIRQYYRRNEAKLTALQRLSLPANYDNSP